MALCCCLSCIVRLVWIFWWLQSDSILVGCPAAQLYVCHTFSENNNNDTNNHSTFPSTKRIRCLTFKWLQDETDFCEPLKRVMNLIRLLIGSECFTFSLDCFEIDFLWLLNISGQLNAITDESGSWVNSQQHKKKPITDHTRTLVSWCDLKR